MDFGKLPRVDGVDFSLPPIGARSRTVLATTAAAGVATAATSGGTGGGWLRLGAPAWARRDWLGKLYPPGTPPAHFLAHYAKAVAAIELNATFYRVPDDGTLAAWAQATPLDFRFCPKVPAQISHDRFLAPDAAALMADFAERLDALGLRLGPMLLQLGPTVAPSGSVARALRAVLSARRHNQAIAVELRHPGWFERGALIDRAADLLAELGAGCVITDVAGRRDVCHATLTQPWLMVRFVGNALDPSDTPRVDAWLDRLVELRGAGLTAAYFFVHQPDDRLAPELLAIAAAGARRRGLAVRGPGEQRGQLGLFG
jgi:uncharacterized protein YecE (DUF72 family)